MRAVLLALTVTLALVVPPPTTASAVPVPDLCTPDSARGGVPAGFVLDACADASALTVRNDLAVPVVVRREGDVGEPFRVHDRGSPSAAVLQVLAGADELLMPGDVSRWPLGPAAATLTVEDIDPVQDAILHTLRRQLPQPGTDAGAVERFQTFAAVVSDVADAVTDRTACAKGKNFLQVTACDVRAASVIGDAVAGQLGARPAAELLPFVVDPAAWAEWTRNRPTQPASVAPSERVLSLAAVPPPTVTAPATSPPVAAPPVTAPPVAAPPAAPVVPPVAKSSPASPSAADAWRAWLEAAIAAAAARSGGTGQDHGDGKGHGKGSGHD